MAVSSVNMRRIVMSSRPIRFHGYGFYRHLFRERSVLLKDKSVLASTDASPLWLSRSRCFSATATPNDKDKDMLNKRIAQIQMNPKSIGRKILPGDFVIRTNPKTGKERKVYTDRAFGYFWMMKDLQETGNKPILSNEKLIPTHQAQIFPTLTDLVTLTDETVDLPDFFLRNNRTKDARVQCTLVAISYKDFGFKLLPSWTEPFQEALGNDNRVEIVHISVVEGWFLKLLRNVLVQSQKRNTPQEQHARTLLKFGSDVADFTDALRMHNTMTSYVYLLDGLGRVRFAGSGTASPEEAESLVGMAEELIQSWREQKERLSKIKRGRDFRPQ